MRVALNLRRITNQRAIVKPFVLLTLLAIVHFGQSQTLQPCRGDNAYIGYCDKEGKVVIEHKFFDGLPFIDGHAAVLVENLWGIINESGNFIVQPVYEEVFNCVNLEDDHILVKKEGKWHLANEYGIAYTTEYEVASPWYEFVIDGKEAQFNQNRWFSVIKKKKWGVVDYNDQIKIPFDYQWIRVFHESKNGQTKPTSIVLKQKDKLAWQRLDAQAATGFSFDKFLGESNNLLFLQAGEKTTIINTITGEMLPRGDKEFYALLDDRDSVGLVNATGKVIVPFKYQQVHLNRVKDHVVFGNYDEFGLADLQGNVLLPATYKGIYELSDSPHTVAVRDQQGLIAIYKLEGETPSQMTPFKYSFVSFGNGQIKINLEARQGTLSLDGKETWVN